MTKDLSSFDKKKKKILHFSRILKDFVAFTAHPDPASKEPLLTDRTKVTFSQVRTNNEIN